MCVVCPFVCMHYIGYGVSMKSIMVQYSDKSENGTRREKETQTLKGEWKKNMKNADKKGANISNDRSVTFVLYDWNEFRMKDREIEGKILLKRYNFWWEPRHNKCVIKAGVDQYAWSHKSILIDNYNSFSIFKSNSKKWSWICWDRYGWSFIWFPKIKRKTECIFMRTCFNNDTDWLTINWHLFQFIRNKLSFCLYFNYYWNVNAQHFSWEKMNFDWQLATIRVINHYGCMSIKDLATELHLIFYECSVEFLNIHLAIWC